MSRSIKLKKLHILEKRIDWTAKELKSLLMFRMQLNESRQRRISSDEGMIIMEIRFNLIEPKLPKFRDGKDNAMTDAYEFIEECNSLFEAHMIPAERWHSGLTSVDRHWAAEILKDLEWNALSNEFDSHFDSPILKDKLMQDLMSCKMGKKESVQIYCDRFRSLTRRTGERTMTQPSRQFPVRV